MANLSRGWCFTINNPTNEDVLLFNDLECRYVVFQKEVGDLGTAHLQGYLYYDTKKSLKQMKKIHSRAHWEQQRGTTQQASDYCKKPETRVEGPWERGELPVKGKRNDLERALVVFQESGIKRVMEEYPVQAVMYGKRFKELRIDLLEDRTDRPTVRWYAGVSGAGKTWTATRAHPTFYIKDNSKWWDGYLQQDAIILDEIKVGKDGWEFEDLKRLFDMYPYQGQTKGGYVKINSPFIYITSPCEPRHFWSGTELVQIERRLSETLRFDEPYVQ